jgi:hypothetical protein
MSATPVRPDPLISPEDRKKLPDYLKMVAEGYARGPKAMWDMPGAMWGMAVRQLPDHQQELLKKLPKIPTLFSVDIRVRKPEQQP